MNYFEQDLLGSVYNTTANSAAVNIRHSLGACVHAIWTNDTGAAKTALCGESEVDTLTFPTKASMTAGDFCIITDTAGGTWGIAMNKKDMKTLTFLTEANTPHGDYVVAKSQTGVSYAVAKATCEAGTTVIATPGAEQTHVHVVADGSVKEVTSITCIAEGSVKEATSVTCRSEGVAKEATGITCIAEGSTKEQTSIVCKADVVDSLDQTVLKLYDHAGSVGVWFDTNAGGAVPIAAAACTRALKVTIATNDLIGTVATALSAALIADGHWTEISNVAGTIIIQDAFGGLRTDAVDISTTFTITTPVQGVASVLDGKYFIMSTTDATTTQAFWFDVDNKGTTEPVATPTPDSYVEITTVTSGMTADQVRAVVDTALGTALYVTTGASGAYFLATDLTTGVREASTAGNSGFTVVQSIVGSVTSALHLKTFVLRDSGGTVGFWFDVDDVAGTIPAEASACTRAVEITTVTTEMTAAQVRGVVYTAVDADAKFECSGASGSLFIATDVEYGARAAASASTSGFTITESITGAASALHGKTFILQDSGGTVGFWFDVDDAAGTIPAEATACTRAVEITTVTSGMTAEQVEGVVYTAVDGDAKFVSSGAVGPLFLATDLEFGARAAASASTSGFTIVMSVDGVTSALDQKYFTLYDDVGSVGFWINVDDKVGATAPVAMVTDRAVEINTITSAMLIGAVGTAIYTEIIGDAKFDAGSDDTLGTFTAMSTTVGDKLAASAGTSGFTITESTKGIWSDGDYMVVTAKDGTTYGVYLNQSGAAVAPAGPIWTALNYKGVAVAETGVDATATNMRTTLIGLTGFTSKVTLTNLTGTLTAKFLSAGSIATPIVWHNAAETLTGISVPSCGAIYSQLQAGSVVEPTGAVWLALAAGVKGLASVLYQGTAAQVAHSFETAFNALSGFSALVTIDESANNGTMTATAAAYGTVANYVPRNTGDTGAGTIVVANTSVGGPSPAGTLWTAIPAANKGITDLTSPSISTADHVATAVQTTLAALTDINLVITVGSASTDSIPLTHVVRGPVTNPVPKNVTEATDGSIAVVETNVGVASVVNITNNTLTIPAHGWTTGLKVVLTVTPGSLPTGLTGSADEFIIVVDANTVQLSDTLVTALAGTARNITDQGTDGSTITVTPTVIAGGVVHLEASLDNINWFDLTSQTANITATGSTMFHATGAYYQFIRVSVTLTAGQITLTAKVAAKDEE